MMRSNLDVNRPPGLFRVDTKQSLRGYVADLWSRRDYLVAVPLGDLRAQNYDTALGNLWHALNPLLLVGVYFLVFGQLLGTDRGVDNFLPFLAVGVFMYQFTQKCAIRGAKAIVDNERLIRSLYFPRAVLPISTVIGEALAFVPAVGVMLLIAVLTGEHPRLGWLLLGALLPLQLVLNLGLAFLTARLTDLFRDVENVLPYVFRIVFYASGILYSVDAVVEDPGLRRLFDLNPVFALVTLARGAVMGGPTSGVLWWSAVGWSLVLFGIGFALFKAGEETYGRG